MRSLERLAQRVPELRLERADAVVAAVLALVDAVARVSAGETLVAPRHPLPRPARRKGKRKPADSGIGHRCVDPAALAAALHTDESTEDRDRGLKAATADVGDLDRQRHRRSVALPVQA